MNRTSAIIFALLATTTLFSSCKRNDDEQQSSYSSLYQAMATAAPKALQVNVNAVNGGTYSTGRSTLIVPANAFEDLSSNPISGIVTVEVQEMLTQSDMIFSRILPVSDGNQLVSAGEFRITATQSGSQVYLRNNVPIELRIPQAGVDATGMQFFRGTMTNDTGANLINWNKPNQGGSSGNGLGTVTYGSDTVHLFTDSLGMVNADRFLSNPNYQSFTVTIAGPAGITSTNTFGYTLYDNYNGVWPLHSFNNSIFPENHIPNIPVHFVVMAVIGGTFYGGIVGAVPANGNNYTVTLNPTTPLALKTQIDAL